MPCRLVVHADDFGQSESINKGILRAFQDGILTSASLMPGGAAFDSAVSICREHPHLDVGIHLTLVEERPVSAPDCVPSLISRELRLHDSHKSFLRRYFRGAIRVEEIEHELDAQLRKVLDAGLAVSHLDSHQHLHVLPGVNAIAERLARRYGISAIRYPRERVRAYMLKRGFGSTGRLVQLGALNGICAFVGRSSLVTTDEFAGFFFGGRLNKSNLKDLIQSLPASGSCELMCHPAIEGDETTIQSKGYRRDRELEALTDDEIRAQLQIRGIELVSFRDLVSQPIASE